MVERGPALSRPGAGRAIRFAARMAWRQTRGARRHVLHVLACVTIGVSALVAVGSFAASLERTVGASARSLLGGDVEVRSAHPLSAEAERALADLARDGVRVLRVRELLAMAQPAAPGPAQLVELKAVEAGYPLYGRLATDPERPLDTLLGGGRVLVHPALLARLGLRVGDRLRLGDWTFTISAVINEEPDRSVGLFSLGPRVLMSAGDLASTGLLQPGSRVRHRTLFGLPGGRSAEAFAEALVERLPDPGLRVTSYAEAQPGLRRFWKDLTLYLGLAGLVALMVGGIGVAASARAFVNEKLASIAILKCLGASSSQVLGAYLLQAAALGAAGSLLGAVLGSALQAGLGPFLGPLLPFRVEFALSPGTVLRGLAMGLGVTLLFSLWPLLEARSVPPALILRRSVAAGGPRRRPWLAALPIAAGLSALALWQAGSWQVGGLFIGGLAAALGLLLLTARLLIALSRRLPRGRGSLAWRHGVANLYRPESHAAAVLVSLGLAVMLIVAVALVERALHAQLRDRGPGQAPAFFFIDIQPDQAAPFTGLVAARNRGVAPELTPVVRSRLAAINGLPPRREARGRGPEPWYLTREYVLTWGAEPPARNRLVAGRWWTAGEAALEPLISLEEELARLLGVSVGDTLTLDVQGVPVTGRVANLREVDWQTLDANFFMIFSPGALDGAPITYIATARVRPTDEGPVQSAVAAAFPNVSAIPVREVLERVSAVLDQIGLAIRLVAAVSVASGAVVMAGALGVTRAQRLYQSVILKALGASRRTVARAYAVEYALLGAAAGLGGTALAAALAAAVLRWVLEVPWIWAPGPLLAGLVAAPALALLVGFLGTFRLLGQPPLSVLRGE